jgi:hypothetical protein
VELSWRTYKSKTSNRLSLNSSIFRYRCTHAHRCTHMHARARTQTHIQHVKLSKDTPAHSMVGTRTPHTHKGSTTHAQGQQTGRRRNLTARDYTLNPKPYTLSPTREPLASKPGRHWRERQRPSPHMILVCLPYTGPQAPKTCLYIHMHTLVRRYRQLACIYMNLHTCTYIHVPTYTHGSTGTVNLPVLACVCWCQACMRLCM